MLESLSVQDIVSNILSKKIKAEEVTEFYLNRIKKLNPVLNAIVSLKDEDLIRDEVKHLKQSNDRKLLFKFWPSTVLVHHSDIRVGSKSNHTRRSTPV